jgi:hypothetical protein
VLSEPGRIVPLWRVWSREAFEDIVGDLTAGFALAGGLKELLAEMAAAQTGDGGHFLEDLLPAVLPFGRIGVHGYVV